MTAITVLLRVVGGLRVLCVLAVLAVLAVLQVLAVHNVRKANFANLVVGPILSMTVHVIY